MSKLIWSTENIHSLGRIFLQKVLSNMREFEGVEQSTVRFGDTGTGEKPNYEVTFPNTRKRTLRGLSHKNYDDADAFNSSNLSSSFSLAEIKAAYEKAHIMK